jgi:hypothetical protein
MKRFAVILLTLSLLAIKTSISPAQASCYGYNGAVRKERIKLSPGRAYISVSDTKDLKREISRLRTGQVVTTLKYIEGNCGGSIYIRFKNSKGRITYGWVESDEFVFSIAD